MRRNPNPLWSRKEGTLVSCTNCGTLIAEGISNASFLAATPAQWALGPWCTVECFLSFIKPNISVLLFTRMRTDISSLLGRSLKERLPRGALNSNGGPLTLQEYHKTEVLEWYDPREKKDVY